MWHFKFYFKAVNTVLALPRSLWFSNVLLNNKGLKGLLQAAFS